MYEQKTVYLVEAASELLPLGSMQEIMSKAITFGSRKIATFSPEAKGSRHGPHCACIHSRRSSARKPCAREGRGEQPKRRRGNGPWFFSGGGWRHANSGAALQANREAKGRLRRAYALHPAQPRPVPFRRGCLCRLAVHAGRSAARRRCAPRHS